MRPFHSWSGTQVALVATVWVVGLPFVLFVAVQLWVFLPHEDTPAVSLIQVHIGLLAVLLVLFGPPLLLVAIWSIAARRAGKR